MKVYIFLILTFWPSILFAAEESKAITMTIIKDESNNSPLRTQPNFMSLVQARAKKYIEALPNASMIKLRAVGEPYNDLNNINMDYQITFRKKARFISALVLANLAEQRIENEQSESALTSMLVSLIEQQGCAESDIYVVVTDGLDYRKDNKSKGAYQILNTGSGSFNEPRNTTIFESGCALELWGVGRGILNDSVMSEDSVYKLHSLWTDWWVAGGGSLKKLSLFSL